MIGKATDLPKPASSFATVRVGPTFHPHYFPFFLSPPPLAEDAAPGLAAGSIYATASRVGPHRRQSSPVAGLPTRCALAGRRACHGRPRSSCIAATLAGHGARAASLAGCSTCAVSWPAVRHACALPWPTVNLAHAPCWPAVELTLVCRTLGGRRAPAPPHHCLALRLVRAPP